MVQSSTERAVPEIGSVPVYQALADALKSHGVDSVFTLMDSETAKLTVELTRRGVSVYATRNEAAAVGMADGYARARARVGVALVGRGPGFTNSLTSLICATKARSRMVLLAGDTSIGIKNPADAAADAKFLKHVDQAAILSAATIESTILREPRTAPAELMDALERASAGHTLVVNMPGDVLEARVRPVGLMRESRDQAEPEVSSVEQLADVAGFLLETWAARHPVILAGRGAVLSGAVEPLRQLGERIGALLATSLMGRSFFAGDPYNIGIVGTFSTPIASELLHGADVVLAFGASLNPWQAGRGTMFPNAKVIQFDSDPSAFGYFMPVDLAIRCDARAAAEWLVSELNTRRYSSSGYRTPEVADQIAQSRLDGSYVDRGSDGMLDPRTLLLAIEKTLPAERTLVVDPGHHLTFSCAYLSVPAPDAFVFPVESGAIGTGLAVALGAAVAVPNRLTVLCVGDGGLMMSLGDLDTAIRYRLPLLILVMNNSAFASELHILRLAGYPDDAARYQNPSFESLARGMGADGMTVSSLADVEEVGQRLRRMTGPLVVDCKVTPEVKADWLGTRWR